MNQQINKSANFIELPSEREAQSLKVAPASPLFDFVDIPATMQKKWQSDLDLIFELTDLSANLFQYSCQDELTVLFSSGNENNPLVPGNKRKLQKGSSLYAVVTKKEELLLAGEANILQWNTAMEFDENVRFCLGLPLLGPNHEVFGLLSLTKNSDERCPEEHFKLLAKFQQDFEKDLQLIFQESDLKQARDKLSLLETELKQHAHRQVEELLVNSHALEDEITKVIETEKDYKRLFDCAPEAMLLVDYNGMIVLANKIASELLGYRAEEFACVNLRNIVSESAIQALFLASRQCLEDESSFTLEHLENLRAASKYGKQFPIEISGKKLMFEGNEVISMVIRDVTAKQDAGFLLEESEKQFRSLFDGVISGVLVLDLNARVLEVNQVFCLALGYERDELLGKDIANFTKPENREELIDKHDKLVNGEIEQHLAEQQYVHKQGHDVWLHIKVSTLRDKHERCERIVVYAQDVTKPKEMEVELKRQNSLLNSIIEGTDDAIFVKDRDGRYQLINTAGAKYLGKDKEQVIGRTEIELVGEEIGQKLINTNREVFDNGELVRLEDEFISTDTGEYLWWNTIKGPVRNDDGEVVSVFGIARNITERKVMENELREKEGLYKNAEQLGQLGYWECDELAGKLSSCSEQYARIFDMDINEIYEAKSGISARLDLIYPEDRDNLLQLVEESKRVKKTSLDMEYRVLTRTGRVRHVHELGKLEYDESGQLTRSFGVLQDITERRVADIALRKSEERYRLLIETMTHGLGVIDGVGNFTFVNDRLCEMLDYSRDELVGMPIANLMDSPNKHILLQQIEQRKQGKYAPYELAWTKKDGGKVVSIVGPAPLFDSEGRYEGSFATVTDITKRKFAEEELRIYKQIVSSTSEFMSFVDLNYVYRAANRKYLDAFGLSEEDVIGSHVADLHGQERFKDAIKSCLDRAFSGETVTARYWMEFTDDNLSYIETIYTPFISESGEVTGAVVSTRDITSLKKMQQELENHQQRLEQEVHQRTEQLSLANEELEAFVHTISHDLKAPLRAVDGFSEWLIEDYAVNMDEQGKHYLKEIQKVASRMGRMIDELLMHARLGERFRILEPVDLNEVLNQVKTDLSSEIGSSGAEIIVSHELPMVEGHRATLEILLRNLISNAMKFVSSGTKPIVKLWCEDTADFYKVFVKDNGIGIDTQHEHLIFNMFERLHSDEEFSGTGVGLAIARKAALLHQGELSLQSVPGQGCTFYFTLKKELDNKRDIDE